MSTNGTILGGRMKRSSLEAERERAEKSRLRLERLKNQAIEGTLRRALASSGEERWVWGRGGNGFESARPNRLKSSWTSRGGSADSWRPVQMLEAMRQQCQSLARNDHLVQGLLGREQDLTIGEGITFQVASDDPEFNNAVEKWAQGWMDGPCDDAGYVRADGLSSGRGIAQLCRHALGAFATDGDIFALLTDRGTVQMVEAQRVRNPGGGFDRSDRGLVNGVRFDASGRVAGYSIAEWETTSGGAYPKWEATEVPAEYVLHLRGLSGGDCPNVTRPEPGLQAMVGALGLIGEYIEDTAAASKIALLFGLISKTEYPQDFPAQIPGARATDQTNADGTSYQRTELELEPAFVAHLKPGESIEQVKPEHPTTVFGDYVKNVLTLLGATRGLPLVLWLLDFGGLNFSSAKSAVLLAYIGIESRRAELVRQFLRPLLRWRVAMALRRGEIPGASIDKVPEGWDKFEFYFPTMPVLEPEKQYDAAVKGINGRLVLPSAMVKQFSGMEFNEFVARFAAEQAAMKAAGIEMVQAPGTGGAGVESGSAGVGGAGSAEDEDDGEDDEEVGSGK